MERGIAELWKAAGELSGVGRIAGGDLKLKGLAKTRKGFGVQDLPMTKQAGSQPALPLKVCGGGPRVFVYEENPGRGNQGRALERVMVPTYQSLHVFSLPFCLPMSVVSDSAAQQVHQQGSSESMTGSGWILDS